MQHILNLENSHSVLNNSDETWLFIPAGCEAPCGRPQLTCVGRAAHATLLALGSSTHATADTHLAAILYPYVRWMRNWAPYS